MIINSFWFKIIHVNQVKLVMNYTYEICSETNYGYNTHIRVWYYSVINYCS